MLVRFLKSLRISAEIIGEEQNCEQTRKLVERRKLYTFHLRPFCQPKDNIFRFWFRQNFSIWTFCRLTKCDPSLIFSVVKRFFWCCNTWRNCRFRRHTTLHSHKSFLQRAMKSFCIFLELLGELQRVKTAIAAIIAFHIYTGKRNIQYTAKFVSQIRNLSI